MSKTLYIHIPFCKSKCFYCSFTSFPDQQDRVDEYLQMLDKEAANCGRPEIETVYVGGGTPTFLSLQQLNKLFRVISSRFVLPAAAEFTMEANPATFDLAKAKALRQAGVNRISLGVQSLRDENLKWLGRPHTAQDALNSYDVLRKAGFRNINLDFIYALPHQEEEGLKSDLKEIESLGSEHISLYALSIEPGTELSCRQIQPLNLERQADHYRMVVTFLKACGLSHYEVSNFARQGFDCRHNSHYWEGGDYIGLGVSAHSHDQGRRYWNGSELSEYISLMRTKGSARAGEETLDALTRLKETFLIGLRMTKGVRLESLEQRFGARLPEQKKGLLRQYISEGLLEEEGGVIRATEEGMLVLDEICGQLY
ncbi:MAG: radical SAM family heme chaperone HemW [Candidatus Omnitrophota bacterium]